MTTDEKKTKVASGSTNDGYGTVHEVDPIGYWDETSGALYFIPKSFKVFDGNIEKAKPATLILGTLTQASPLFIGGKEDDDQEKFVGKEGDFIAVWGKPGMAALKDKGNVPVKLWQEGEKDTGKPNPMKLYKVATKGVDYVQAKIPCVEDTRNKSFGVACFLERNVGRRPQNTGRSQSSGTSNVEDMDDIPF